MNILVSMPAGTVRDTFITPEIAPKIEMLGNVEWNNTPVHFSSAELNEKLKNTDICISGWNHPMFDKTVLEGNERLKLVAHTGGSVAPFVGDYFYDKGIRIISGNRIYAESVAEGVIAYTLCALRDIPVYNDLVQQGGWKQKDYFNESLFDQTVGLVGFGMISEFVIGMLKPYRTRIKVFSKHISDETCAEYAIERASLEEIFCTCKVISIHTSKRPDTYHMINEELLRMILDGALLVNTARGNIIDEKAMATELRKGRFKAVLDVYEAEPLPQDSELKGLKNVILMPHMAGPTVDRRKYATLALLDDIQNFLEDKPMHNEIDRNYAMNMTR